MLDEILSALTRVQDAPPVEALAAAGENRAELTPRLLACLADVVAQPALLEGDRDIELPFYAMYLLAAWREAAAHPLLLGFLRLPGEQCLELSGDIVTQDMDRMLAQTAGGELRGLLALARGPAVNVYARMAAIKALSHLTAWGELPRESLVAHYRELLAAAGPPEHADDPGPLLGQYVCCALDLGLVELRDELLVAMDRGWIEESFVGSRDDVEADFARPPKPPESPIDNVARAIRWWRCFKRKSVLSGLPPAGPSIPDASAGRFDASPQPYRAPEKIGRNDPCPCGSGKKYKKCCGG